MSKSKKILVALVSFTLTFSFVLALVLVPMKAKPKAGAATQALVDDATTYVTGLTTNKSANLVDANTDTYRLDLTARADSETLTPAKTDFEIVVDTSSPMDEVLYTRNITNLQNGVKFSKHAMKGSNHIDMRDYDNPSNSLNGGIMEKIIETLSSSDYQGLKFVEDPSVPNVYVYLAQTSKAYTSGSGLSTKENNEFSYTFTDSDGNVYESTADTSSAASAKVFTPYTVSWSSLNVAFIAIKSNWNTPNSMRFLLKTRVTDGAPEEVYVDNWYEVSAHNGDDSSTLYDNSVLASYALDNSRKLYIMDDQGVQHRIFISAKMDNATYNATLSETDVNRVTDVIYTIYENDDPNGRVLYQTHQGNMVYGSLHGVFQGFRELKQNPDGTYQVDPTTGEFVVDHSKSIEHTTLYIDGQQKVTKLIAAREALEDLVISIHQEAAENGVEQRVGLVSYKNVSRVGISTPKATVEVDLPDGNLQREDSLGNMIYEIYKLNTSEKVEERPDEGLDKAYSEFKDHSSGRKTVCLAVIGGYPRRATTTFNDGYSTDSADLAIESSYKMKTQLGTKVYSFGLFTYANVDQLYGDKDYHFDWTGSGKNNVACTGRVGSVWGATFLSNITQNTTISPHNAAANNRFLNYLSSNSPDAQEAGIDAASSINILRKGFKIHKNWTCSNEGYYFAVSDRTYNGMNDDGTVNDTVLTQEELRANLLTAMQSIKDAFRVPATKLTESCYIYDGVSKYFDFADPENVDVHVYENGTDKTGEYTVVYGDIEDYADDNRKLVVIDTDNNIVAVKGYNYSAHVGEALKVSFNVKRHEGFIAGTNVPTNTINAGVYDGDGLLEGDFPRPAVDLATKYHSGSVSDQSIYTGHEANLADFINPSSVDGFNNQFVNLSYVIKDGSNTIGTYTIPAGETYGEWSGVNASDDTAFANAIYPQMWESKGYTVVCTVTPLDNSLGTVTETSNPKVYVFSPAFQVVDGHTSYNAQEDITPEVAWELDNAGKILAGSNTPAAPEDLAPNITYTIHSDTKDADVTDQDAHTFTSDETFSIGNVAEDDYSFNYTNHHWDILMEDTYDDNGNVTGQTQVKDEDGNPVYGWIDTEKTVERTCGSLPDEAYTVYNGTRESQINEFTWDLSKYALDITKIFSGDYMNADAVEDVTFTVTGNLPSGETSQVVNISKEDFTDKHNGTFEATADAVQLYCGVEYNVAETWEGGMPLAQEGGPLYEITYAAKEGSEGSVTASTDGLTINCAEGTNVGVIITNKNMDTPGPITGIGDVAHSNPTTIKIIAIAAMFLVIIGSAAGYKFFIKQRSE